MLLSLNLCAVMIVFGSAVCIRTQYVTHLASVLSSGISMTSQLHTLLQL